MHIHGHAQMDTPKLISKNTCTHAHIATEREREREHLAHRNLSEQKWHPAHRNDDEMHNQ